MTTLNPNRYPVDYSGAAATNLISNELVTLAARRVRAFAPRNGPFFQESLVLRDRSTNTVLTGSQFRCIMLNGPATAISGKAIYCMIVVTDQTVGTELEATYQTVGGDYVQSFDAIIDLLSAVSEDTRPANWDNIVDREDLFNPTQHMHPIGETMGWEYMAFGLQTLGLAVLLGDDVRKDSILRYIDASLANSNAAIEAQINSSSEFGRHVLDVQNPHQVTPAQINLGNLRNYAVATAQQAMEGTRSDLYVTVDVLAAAIQNVVNGGMDAHIGDHNNPHQLTPGQLGLGNVRNYAEAVVGDLTTPNQADPKYITNITLATWLVSFMATKNQAYADSLNAIGTQLSSLATAANTATTGAQAAAAAAQTATSNTTQAISLAQATLDQANANEASIVNAQTAAQAAITAYVTQAVAAADAAGYSRGYADGQAA